MPLARVSGHSRTLPELTGAVDAGRDGSASLSSDTVFDAHRYTFKHATRFRAEMRKKEAREWTVLPKEEPSSGNSKPAKHAKEESAQCSRAVIQQNITKLASIAARSTAAQTVNPLSGGSSLLRWLTSMATKSTATQTADPVEDGRSLQHWRSIQWKYWLELQRGVQHSIQ